MAEHFREDSGSTVAVRLDSEHPQGVLFDPYEPQLRVSDLGVVRGDGIFETLLAVDGVTRKLSAHLQRFARSAELTEIGIPPAEAWRAAIDRGLSELDARGGIPAELMIRISATRGVENEPASEDPDWAGSYWALLGPVPEKVIAQRGEPIAVTLLDRGYDSTIAERAPWLLLSAKTLSYAVNMAAYRWAHQHGYDDVIFTSSDGYVLEGPTSTVLLLSVDLQTQRPQLTTPTLKTGILPGTSQGAVFAAAEQAGWDLAYGPITAEALQQADHLWLISSLRLASPIQRVDGHDVEVSQHYTEKLLEFLQLDLAQSYPTE